VAKLDAIVEQEVENSAVLYICNKCHKINGWDQKYFGNGDYDVKHCRHGCVRARIFTVYYHKTPILSKEEQALLFSADFIIAGAL